MRYAELSTRRHTAVVDRVRKAASCKLTILAENEAVCGNLRPDVVIANNITATIDITVPFENRLLKKPGERSDASTTTWQ
jgi:type II secretory pathway component GspD/PulD (secretin)